MGLNDIIQILVQSARPSLQSVESKETTLNDLAVEINNSIHTENDHECQSNESYVNKSIKTDEVKVSVIFILLCFYH